MSASILVVDDEPAFRLLAEDALRSEGYEVRVAGTLKKARAEADASSPDVIILDRRLPDGDGIELLKGLNAHGSSGPVVLMVTAYGDVDNAVAALRAGAWDYLSKPLQLTDLLVKLRKLLEARGLKDRLKLARVGATRPPLLEPKSEAMQQVMHRLRSVAISPLTPVLLDGPSGVGKQFAAEVLHQQTWAETDQEAPFVEINCAALPEDLVESELFGHEKGAFTDAKGTRRGLIEMAAGGTLFLDEVTELPMHSQAKLLKFIDSMRFRRVGGQREIEVQLRVVAATNRDAAEMVRRGTFREDLYHRLSVFRISIPPLRERKQDIAPLAAMFGSFFSSRVKRRAVSLSAEAAAVLDRYDYPGNVRELRNIMERAVILCQGASIAPTDIILSELRVDPDSAPAFFSVPLGSDGNPPSLDVLEQRYAKRLLKHTGGQRQQAARLLGVSYPTFLKLLREGGEPPAEG